MSQFRVPKESVLGCLNYESRQVLSTPTQKRRDLVAQSLMTNLDKVQGRVSSRGVSLPWFLRYMRPSTLPRLFRITPKVRCWRNKIMRQQRYFNVFPRLSHINHIRITLSLLQMRSILSSGLTLVMAFVRCGPSTVMDLRYQHYHWKQTDRTVPLWPY